MPEVIAKIMLKITYKAKGRIKDIPKPKNILFTKPAILRLENNYKDYNRQQSERNGKTQGNQLAKKID